MANVSFTGAVSAQAASGETVTITVALPDGTTQTLTATTAADMTFSTSQVFTEVGDYTADATIAADADYSAADSGPVAFTVTPATRTITLSVALS